MIDPIADMLTRIRNALAVKKAYVEIPLSRIKWEIALILKEEGFIEEAHKDERVITITLKYEGKEPAITSLKRVSKPGCRIYAKAKELPVVLDNLGIAIVSTPQGVMTNKQARKKRVGGEVLCEIY